MTTTNIIGLDIGQRRDYTAIAVVEASERRTGKVVHISGLHLNHDACYPEMEDAFTVTDIGRLKLGTQYPKVALHVADVVDALNARGIMPYLMMDVTGVGRPVFDILSSALADLDCYLSAVTLTAGHNLRGYLGSPEVSLPKELLVSRVQALLQTERVKMPDTPETRALAEELRTFELRVSDEAKLTSGAFKTGAHDDLVIALGLAVLFDPRGANVTYSDWAWG